MFHRAHRIYYTIQMSEVSFFHSTDENRVIISDEVSEKKRENWEFVDYLEKEIYEEKEPEEKKSTPMDDQQKWPVSFIGNVKNDGAGKIFNSLNFVHSQRMLRVRT